MLTKMALAATAICGCDSAVATSDAGPSSGVIDVHCDTHDYVDLRADGSKFESKTFFALVDGVEPTDGHWLEMCGQTVTYLPNMTTPTSCPTGDTCTESGADLPDASATCFWSQGGSFVDGKLYISCGNASISYAASGSITSGSEVKYAAIRLHR